MTFKQITPGFSVSGQLSLDDLNEAVAQGFKSIICNRPGQSRGSGQPTGVGLCPCSRNLGRCDA